MIPLTRGNTEWQTIEVQIYSDTHLFCISSYQCQRHEKCQSNRSWCMTFERKTEACSLEVHLNCKKGRRHPIQSEIFNGRFSQPARKVNPPEIGMREHLPHPRAVQHPELDIRHEWQMKAAFAQTLAESGLCTDEACLDATAKQPPSNITCQRHDKPTSCC